MSRRCHLIPWDNLKWHKTNTQSFFIKRKINKEIEIHAYLNSNNMQPQDSTAFQTNVENNRWNETCTFFFTSQVFVYIYIYFYSFFLFVSIYWHMASWCWLFFRFLLYSISISLKEKQNTHISSINRSTRSHNSALSQTKYMNRCTVKFLIHSNMIEKTERIHALANERQFCALDVFVLNHRVASVVSPFKRLIFTKFRHNFSWNLA